MGAGEEHSAGGSKCFSSCEQQQVEPPPRPPATPPHWALTIGREGQQEGKEVDQHVGQRPDGEQALHAWCGCECECGVQGAGSSGGG